MSAKLKSLFGFHDILEVNEQMRPYVTIPEFKMELQFKQKASECFIVKHSKDLEVICRKIIGDGAIDWYESFIVIALSRSNKVINYYRISKGGITGTVADPKIILQFALACNASSLVLCHNHPSGATKPSRSDEDLTNKIKNAAAFLDIHVVDHIIITSDSYYSFLDDGLL